MAFENQRKPLKLLIMQEISLKTQYSAIVSILPTLNLVTKVGQQSLGWVKKI